MPSPSRSPRQASAAGRLAPRAVASTRSRVRRAGAIALAIIALAATGLVQVAHATTYLSHAPQEMIGLADGIFVGTVVDVSVADRQGTPWTEVRFEVNDLLKGTVDTGADQQLPLLTLAFLGGAMPGGEVLTVAGMPAFAQGERVLAFIYDEPYASPVVGFRQGLWRITPGGLRDDDGVLLSVASDGTLVAGGDGASLEAVLSALKAQLPDLGAGNEGQP